MQLGTKNVVTTSKDFISSYVSYGINKLKIKAIDLREWEENVSYQLTFKVETPEITDDNFKPADDAKGQVGNIQLRLNMKYEWSVAAFNEIIGNIADCLDIREAIDGIKFNSVEQYIKELESIFTNGKFAWFVVAGKEWAPGKFNLSFPRYNFCAADKDIDDSTAYVEGGRIISVAKNSGKMITFDRSSKYHFQHYVEPKQTDDTQLNSGGLGTLGAKIESKVDDLPFGDSSDDLPFNRPSEQPSFLQ